MGINTCNLADDKLVATILDPSYVSANKGEVLYLEKEARKVIFAMHNRSATADGRSSMYNWAVARAQGPGE